jgi:hypothetical protein
VNHPCGGGLGHVCHVILKKIICIELVVFVATSLQRGGGGNVSKLSKVIRNRRPCRIKRSCDLSGLNRALFDEGIEHRKYSFLRHTFRVVQKSLVR